MLPQGFPGVTKVKIWLSPLKDSVFHSMRSSLHSMPSLQILQTKALLRLLRGHPSRHRVAVRAGVEVWRLVAPYAFALLRHENGAYSSFHILNFAQFFVDKDLLGFLVL